MIISSYLEISEREIRELGTTVEEIQRDLTLPNPEYVAKVRFGKGKYMINTPKEICYLRKKGESYILPRNYFSETLYFTDKRIEGRDIEVSHNITLRDYQEEYFAGMNILEEDVILNMPTGHGKTTCAIYRSSKIGKQTLILVPTYYLARQWEQRVSDFSVSSCHVLSPNDTDVPLDRDFTVVLLETLTVRELPKEFIQNIGHVIVDEAHRSGCESYLPLLDIFPARYRTALTATFRRADGVHKILKHHFGSLVTMDNVLPRPKVYGVMTGVDVQGVVSKNRPTGKLLDFLDTVGEPYHETKSSVSFNPLERISRLADKMVEEKRMTKTDYREIMSGIKHAKDISYTVMESYLNDHSGRRKIIISLIEECMKAGRTILFLAKRKDILKSLHKYFAKYKPMLIVSETNSRTAEEDRYLQEECKLIFGVTQLAKEGLDIARLDTLIISCGISDLTQAIGRISRIEDGKKYPMAFYLLDNNYMAYSTFKKAQGSITDCAEYMYNKPVNEIKTIVRFAD